GGCDDTGDSADGVRLRGRSRDGNEGRRIRFPAKAGRSGSPEVAGAACGEAAGIVARELASARRVFGAVRVSAHRGRTRIDTRDQPADTARGADRFDGAAAWRKRDGQGIIRARGAPFVEPAGAAVCGAELRGDTRGIGRE